MTISRKIALMVVIPAALILFSALAATAEETATAAAGDGQAQALLAPSANLADEPQALAGVNVAEPAGMPTNFGLWWRDLREKISLALTADPVKKSEKALVFAEERIKLADYINQNAADEKIRAKAQDMMAKAGEYLQKIQSNQADLLKNPGDKAKTLLNNLTAQYANTERVLEKMEDKTPAENLEKFQALRAALEARAEKFLDNLSANQSVPDEVKAKIIQVKNSVAEKLKVRLEYRAEQKEILEKIKALKNDLLETKDQGKTDLRENRQNSLLEIKEVKSNQLKIVRPADSAAGANGASAAQPVNRAAPEQQAAPAVKE